MRAGRAPKAPTPINFHSFRLFVAAALSAALLVGGCAKPPRGIGVTQIKAKSQSELQSYLLAQKPDVERFASRGPFAVAVHLDHEIRLSPTEAVMTDRYVAVTGEKGPLVIFLHGYDNSKADHAYQAFHVASWGMHALSVQLPNTGPWTGNGRTLARLASVIQRTPEIVDRRVDPSRIVLIGHSFGASSVAVALGEGAPAAGGVLLDAAGIGKELTRFLKQINKPVLLLGADEYTTTTRNRDLFYGLIPRGVAEVSIKDAGHEDAQFPADRPLHGLGSASIAADEGQLTFVSALTSGAFSLSSTGALDYAWSSFSEALGTGKFMNARRK